MGKGRGDDEGKDEGAEGGEEKKKGASGCCLCQKCQKAAPDGDPDAAMEGSSRGKGK